MVRATIYDRNHAFLVDTKANISLLPYSVVKANNLPVRRRMVQQPVMVDGPALRCAANNFNSPTFRPPEAAPSVASIRDDWSMVEVMKAQQRDPLLTEISDIVGMDQVGPRVDMGNQSKAVKTVLRRCAPEDRPVRSVASVVLLTLVVEVLRLAHDESFSENQEAKKRFKEFYSGFGGLQSRMMLHSTRNHTMFVRKECQHVQRHEHP